MGLDSKVNCPSKQNLYFMKIAHQELNKSADQVQEDYNKLAEYQWIIVNWTWIEHIK